MMAVQAGGDVPRGDDGASRQLRVAPFFCAGQTPHCRRHRTEIEQVYASTNS